MFELKSEIHNKVLILRLTGAVTLPEAVDFNAALEEEVNIPQINQVMLDLSAVDTMDAAGLGVLVSISTKLRCRGRRLALLNPAPHVVATMQQAAIDGFFPTCGSEEELKGFICSVH